MQAATATDPGKQLVRTFFKEPRKKLNSREKTALRKRVCFREDGICQECGDYAPLYDKKGQFNLWTCGHAAHIKSEGAGGDDTPENRKWKCARCHLGVEHAPRWSKGKTYIPSAEDFNRIEFAEKFKMPFGKHTGKRLGKIPDGYVQWLSDKCREEDIATMAATVLKWRKEHGIIVKSEQTFH